MRRVVYKYEETVGALPLGWRTTTGWFHKFVVVREDKQMDEVYALVETKTGGVEMIRRDRITFPDRPKTSEE